MSLILNEQTKLSANLLNTLAAAAVTVGVIGPIAAAIVGFPSPPFDLTNFVIGVAVWLLAGSALHSAARYVLEELHDDEG